jgi:SAM-dependent methyltransferase
MSLWETVAAQFGKPSGFLGVLAGFIMANRSSNKERIEWGISLLDIQPADHVLEIGFGPGVAIQRMCDLVTDGIIYGIDHSELMVRKASDRNKNATESGKAKLILAWDDPVKSLQEIKKVMTPHGIITIVHQPRKPGATDQDSTAAGDRFSEYLEQAQFTNIRIEKKLMKPVSTVCVLGTNS